MDIGARPLVFEVFLMSLMFVLNLTMVCVVLDLYILSYVRE
jgi:hypothetical protein